MAYREITDPAGRRWRVWDTYPQEFGGRSIIAEGFASGWLTFECDAEKRRVAPVPRGWAERDGDALLQLLESADAVEPAASG